MNDSVETSGRTRQEKTKRVFINDEGESTPRAHLNSVSGQVTFVGSGEVLAFSWDDFTPEVQRAAGLFGIMTSVTNTVGRAGMSEADMVQAATDRLGTLLDGEWSSDTRSGPRTSDLIEAVRRAYAERNMELSEEKEAKIKAKLSDEKTGSDYRNDLLGRTLIRAHFEAIKAERAQARAAKAQEEARSGNADDLDI